MGFGPVNTAVRDALPIDEGLAGNELLSARHQVALEHNADDLAVTTGDLAGDVAADR